MRFPSGDHAGVVVLEVAVGELPRRRPRGRRSRRACGGRRSSRRCRACGTRAGTGAACACVRLPRRTRRRGRARVRTRRDESGRPLRTLDALLQIGELARFAALGGNDVQVRRRLLVLAAVRHEREPPAVGGPARRAVAPLAGGELARLVEPSTRATQIAPRYSFESLSIDQTTYATRVPSGEMRGSRGAR